MTDRYAVIGNPIQHSKSPLIHAAFAQTTAQAMSYTRLEAPLGAFEAVANAFRLGGGLGMNVTLPFKVDAFRWATDKMPAAELAGAANALKFDGDRILCDNFDGVGLVRDITSNLGQPVAGAQIALLGAGGAARGAILPLLAQKPSRLLIVNRSPAKAQELTAHFAAAAAEQGCALEAAGYDEIGSSRFDLIINATSASLGTQALPLPASMFERCGLAYDMVYGKGLTPFLAQARQSGVTKQADGVGMLVEQAAEAFVWWRGVRPDTRPVIDQLTIPLV